MRQELAACLGGWVYDTVDVINDAHRLPSLRVRITRHSLLRDRTMLPSARLVIVLLNACVQKYCVNAFTLSGEHEYKYSLER